MKFIVVKDKKYFYIIDNHGRFTNDKTKATEFTKSEAKRIAIQIDGIYKANNEK